MPNNTPAYSLGVIHRTHMLTSSVASRSYYNGFSANSFAALGSLHFHATNTVVVIENQGRRFRVCHDFCIRLVNALRNLIYKGSARTAISVSVQNVVSTSDRGIGHTAQLCAHINAGGHETVYEGLLLFQNGLYQNRISISPGAADPNRLPPTL